MTMWIFIKRLLASAANARPTVRPCLAVERLEDRTVPSTVTIAAMGDSITATYTGQPWGAAGDHNWVEQLRSHEGRRLAIDDVAVAGATSADLLAQGQA